MKKRNIFTLAMLLLLGMVVISSQKVSSSFTSPIVAKATGLSVGLAGDPINTDKEAQSYYSSISSEATEKDLLSALHSLNSSKRKKTVGYKNMGKYYKQTDGDPNNSNNIIVFYSGKSVPFSGSFGSTGNSVNREHVWPNSRNGSNVEGDIHMPRPTLASENGSRGNSFYVEGKKTSNSGWDPAMESFGLEKYRGISARIIFYCAMADTSLTLIDREYDSASNGTMGKLSDLLKWNLKYEIDATEIKRNEAAQDIQGNRNPFIDDRSLACKIWGNTNDNTRKVCTGYVEDNTPTSIELSTDSISLKMGETANISWSILPESAVQLVNWSYTDDSIVSINSKGEITPLKPGTTIATVSSTVKPSVQTTLTITVEKKPDPVEVDFITLKGTANKLVYQAGDTFDGTGLTIEGKRSDNGEIIQISPDDLIWFDANTNSSILSQGTTSVYGIYGSKHKCVVEGLTVNESSTNTITKIEVSGSLKKNSYLVGETFSSSGIKVMYYEKNGFFAYVDLNEIDWNSRPLALDEIYQVGTWKNAYICVEIEVKMNSDCDLPDDDDIKKGCAKSSSRILFSLSFLAICLVFLRKRKF